MLFPGDSRGVTFCYHVSLVTGEPRFQRQTREPLPEYRCYASPDEVAGR